MFLIVSLILPQNFSCLCRPSLGSNMFGFTGYWGLMNPRKMFCVASFGNIHLLVCKTILPFMFLGSLGSKKVSFPQGNSDLSSALIAERNVVWWNEVPVDIGTLWTHQKLVCLALLDEHSILGPFGPRKKCFIERIVLHSWMESSSF